jgi:hypothetical protein
MRTLKLVLLAGTLATGLSTVGAQAMPINNLGTVDVGASVDTVRWVCSPYSGQCWWRPNYYSGYVVPYYGFYGYRGYRGYRGGYRGGWRGRR